MRDFHFHKTIPLHRLVPKHEVKHDLQNFHPVQSELAQGFNHPTELHDYNPFHQEPLADAHPYEMPGSIQESASLPEATPHLRPLPVEHSAMPAGEPAPEPNPVSQEIEKAIDEAMQPVGSPYSQSPMQGGNFLAGAPAEDLESRMEQEMFDDEEMQGGPDANMNPYGYRPYGSLSFGPSLLDSILGHPPLH